MLRIVNTEVTTDEDTGATITTHTVEGSAVLNEDSIWEYNYEKHGNTLRVNSITIIEEDDYTLVNVVHEGSWRVYTDSGFEESISAVLGFDVMFTEQGMQDDNFASMEV